MRSFAEYIASINLSTGSWKYPLKTHPRPTGAATHVIITEYDLPRALTEPHDVILDKQGNAWYSDFGAQVLGELREEPTLVRLQQQSREYLRPDLRKESIENGGGTHPA